MTHRRSHIDRRALFSSAAAAAVFAASGVSAAPRPVQGGRFRLALSGGTRADSWALGDGVFMRLARRGLIYETLTEVAANGALKEELATGWDSRGAGRTWHFELRENVRFHDGKPFGSRDVVASLKGRLNGEIKAVGGHAVEISLREPDPNLPFTLARADHLIQPAHAMDQGVGTGLYQLDQFVPGGHLRASRVAEHYKDGVAGWFDEVELTSIPSEAVRGQALCECLVDAADLSEVEMLAGFPDILAQPNRDHAMQAHLAEVMHPARVSTATVFDDLRAPQRWWFG